MLFFHFSLLEPDCGRRRLLRALDRNLLRDLDTVKHFLVLVHPEYCSVLTAAARLDQFAPIAHPRGRGQRRVLSLLFQRRRQNGFRQ